MMLNQTTREFLKYCIVGAVGFIIDGGILLWLTNSANGGVNAYFSDPYLARLISFPIAVTATWVLHRLWTFADGADAAKGRQYAGYFILQLAASLMNYAVYAGVIGLYGASQPILMLGFALGSAIGLTVNYSGARWLVFRPR
jgi:putative flippase GtrA